MKTLTPEQLHKLSEVQDRTLRQRFAVYYQLPDDVRETMRAEHTTQTMWSIARDSHTLSNEKVRSVAFVVGLTMMGLLPIQDFVKNLASYAQLEPRTAQEIAQAINKQIFQPVRESLIQIHSLEEKNSTALEPAVPKEEKREMEPPEEPSERAAGPRQTPVGLDELEERESRQPLPEETTTPAPRPDDTGEKESPEDAHRLAEQRRAELIERLKKAQPPRQSAPDAQQPARTSEGAPPAPASTYEGVDKKPKKRNGPTATQAAWNGKTIDLRKVPPRRESPSQATGSGRKGEWEENGIRYLDPRDLA